MLSKKPIAVFKMLYKRFMASADGGHTHTKYVTLVRMRRALIIIPRPCQPNFGRAYI